MRQAVLYIHDARGAWVEKYLEGARGSFRMAEPDVERWAQQLLARFNNALQPHETWRTLDRVDVTEIGDPSYRPDHAWSKTNAITISDRVGVYDAMRCSMCGVTAKRFGLDRIKIDAKWRAKKYQRCGWQTKETR